MTRIRYKQTDLLHTKRITSADSPFQATPGDLILADASTAAITINAPTANLLDGHRFSVKKTDVTPNFVTTTATNIETKVSRNVGTAFVMFEELAAATWAYDQTADTWRTIATANIAPWLEAWSATPIIIVPGTPTTIVWTFMPLYTGQTPQLVSHSAGTFTAQLDLLLNLDLSILWQWVMAGNNQDTTGILDAVYGGAGQSIFIESEQAFTSPRTGTWQTSSNTSGLLASAVSDTFSFTAASDPTQTGQTDLAECYLFLSAG
jgi:hypothetical protein